MDAGTQSMAGILVLDGWKKARRVTDVFELGRL
jgi:hypothetical protein